MQGEQPVRVLVEIRHTGKTISGQVAVEGASPSDFFGWLELIDRLEHAAEGSGRGLPVDSREEPISEELQ
ncbi:MAG TPA: hypothetical protein VMF57_04745 [Solirubrobacteraceae bacterium]|nr:hypothetical protein [Solirubrobacteraceae bacterium]